MIGDILGKRYQIADKLGYGGYSTVWLAYDTLQKAYVALKIGISDSRLNETTTLKTLSAATLQSSSDCIALAGFNAIPPLLDEFTVQGPNGTHPCFTTTLAQCSLRDAAFSRLFHLDVARALAVKLVAAVAYMHQKGYMHGDIHLGNAMLRLPSNLDSLSVKQFHEKYGNPETVPISRSNGGPLPPNVPNKAVLPVYLGKKSHEIALTEIRLILSDLGEAFTPTLLQRPCKDCRSPLAARPPEARFDPTSPLSFSADIWSLAVALWKLVGMKPLFSDVFVTPDEIVAQQVDTLGPLPLHWWKQWEQRLEFFDDDGISRQGEDAWPPLSNAFDEWVQHYRRKLNMGVFSEEEKDAFLSLIRRMMSFEPQKRPTIVEVLESDWIRNWALPDFKRSLESDKR